MPLYCLLAVRATQELLNTQSLLEVSVEDSSETYFSGYLSFLSFIYAFYFYIASFSKQIHPILP